jgi:hypothetical protein
VATVALVARSRIGSDLSGRQPTSPDPSVHERAASGGGRHVRVLGLQARAQGVTPLQMASAKGHAHIADMLLSKGADVNQPRTDGGATALHAASQ